MVDSSNAADSHSSSVYAPIKHAILLAAGLGARMRPLTDACPKPLLQAGGRALIEHHLIHLSQLGIEEVVINISYLADQIRQKLGDGEKYGLNISYSHEPVPLETAGGIRQALPLLGDDKFLVINADVWIEFDFVSWLSRVQKMNFPVSLVLVDNPAFNAEGDFYLFSDGRVRDVVERSSETAPQLSYHRLTYAGVGVYSVNIFSTMESEAAPLAPWLRKWMEADWVQGIHHAGGWSDVGTPERLDLLRKRIGK